MMTAVSSSMYRSKGGGAYLHGSGWHRLTVDQRKKILEAFDGSPFAVEMGFGNGRAHHMAYGERVKKEYLDLGVHPRFIAVNAYWKGKIPTVEDWKYYTKALRIHGVSKKTLIVPTFEYANFRWHMAALADNEISDRPDFQAIVTHSKGLALDCAPQYFLDYRDTVYKDWIIDAVQWAKGKGFTSIIIASPWKAMDQYEEYTVRFLDYLITAEALPDVIVIENFEAHPKPGYVPVVGREWIPDTTLGVAWYLLNNYFQ